MRDLVQKLPSGNPQRDVGTSDDTIAAVLATLNEVIKKHPEFSRFVENFNYVYNFHTGVGCLCKHGQIIFVLKFSNSVTVIKIQINILKFEFCLMNF